MQKKSQAALEFLTTYAWAFIAIAVAISSLYYFGLFDFNKFLPQKCAFPEQFKCLDFSIRPSQLNIKLVNNIGEDICIKSMAVTDDNLVHVTCTGPSLAPPVSCSQNEFDWSHASNQDFAFSCSGGTYLPDERVELKVLMTYYAINTPSKPVHAITGKVSGRVTTN